VLVEVAILIAASRHNSAQVLRDAATLYKVDVDAICQQVKQEFAAKEKTLAAKKTVAKTKPKPARKAKAA
jgi:ParB family chromosome partitioning protein